MYLIYIIQGVFYGGRENSWIKKLFFLYLRICFFFVNKQCTMHTLIYDTVIVKTKLKKLETKNDIIENDAP